MNKYALIVFILFNVLLSTRLVYSFSSDETIEVYYLIAPLMASKYGYLLANFNAFHAGLGFVSLDSHEEYTVDFYAYPTITGSFFPTVVNKSDSNSGSNSDSSSSDKPLPDLIWNTAGMVQYQELINDTYWISRELMFKITGEQFQEYLCWLPNYNTTYTYYNLFDVKDIDTGDTFIPSSTCYDFVWASFTALYALGGSMQTQTPPNRDFVTLMVTTEPSRVDHPESPDNWRQITEFYSRVSFQPNQTITNYIASLSVILNGTFFLHIDNVYYNLSLTPTNPIDIAYSPQPLPWGTPNDSILNLNASCFPSKIKKSSIGGGWIFIIILISFSGTYLVGGILINKFLFKRYGYDLIPNKNGWIGFGNLVSDGFGYLKFKITGNNTYKYHSGNNNYSGEGESLL